jgi:S1-C subfamily serine protease
MVNLECPRWCRPARLLLIWLGFVVPCLAEPAAVLPRWQVNFPAAANGRMVDATAVPVEGNSILVSVVASGADPLNPKLQLGNRSIPVKVIGHDPVSRLQFLQIQDNISIKAPEWLKDTGSSDNASMVAMAPGGPVKCRTTGWIKQVGGKVLPLALLQVTFGGAVPPSGTPLMDDAGCVAAIVFQGAGAGNIGYAIPAEAVRRVQRDICSGGHLIRGWLGLSLRAETSSPQIIRVLPDSPAAAAGIQPGDVLVSIGSRQVTEYADAANAFFYLIPGQPVKVKLLRGVDQLEYSLVPTKAVAK